MSSFGEINPSCGFEEYCYDKKSREGGIHYCKLFIYFRNMFIIQTYHKCYRCCFCVVILIN